MGRDDVRTGGWRPPTKGEERRANLLAALEGLLGERRLAEISVDDIAQAAGVRRTAFYFYFSSKSTAVAALLEDAFDDVLAGAADFLDRQQRPVAALRAALAELWTWWRKREPLMVAMLDARDTDAEVRELWNEWLERFVEPVATVIEAERREGRAPDGPDARELVRLLVAMNAAALERRSRAGGADDAAISTTFDGIVAVWTRAFYGRVPDASHASG